MSRDPRLYLEDMLESGNKVLRYTRGMTFEEFLANEMAFDAVLRNLEIIGEAAKNVSDEVRARYPEVEWRRIAALRNVLAHAYFGLEAETLWDIVTNKVPVLVTQVEAILNAEGGASS